ncbi:MAG: glycosyltransferase family 2 protein [Patescibacteria group bacterium]
MNISIVIPNYNGEELLRKNLPKLIEAVCNYKDIEIIIVDDGSTDDSINIIQNSKFKVQNRNLKLRVIKNKTNLGFSSTVNKGAKEAKGDILVLLNTDVVPEKDFLKPLMEHFNDESVFAVGCMDKSIENGKTVLRGRGIGKWKKGFLVHKRGEINKTNTLWVGGGSGAFRKLIWDKLGGLNQIYNPFYWEDIDLSYRALKSGYKVLFEPKSIVYHEHEKGAIRKKFSPFKIKTIAYRNQFIFVWENATDISLQFLHVFWLPYHFLKALIRLDAPFFIGFFKAFILLPKIIQSSFKAQKLFIKSDREVIKEFFK